MSCHYTAVKVIITGFSDKYRGQEAALAVFMALMFFGFIAIVLKVCNTINKYYLGDLIYLEDVYEGEGELYADPQEVEESV